MKTAKKSPMDEYLKKHPFLAETANLQLAMEKILTGAVSPVSFPEKDDIVNLVKDGMPLLQQPKLQRTMVKVAAVSLGDCLESLKDLEAPEMMKAAIKAWQSWTVEAELTEIQQFFDYLLRQEDAEIQSFVADNKLNEALVRTLGWQIVEVLVPAEVKDPVFWQGIGWKRNYCPVCGRQPVLAQLRKEQEGRARVLACDGCHTVWPYARLGCVYCGNDDLKEMHILEPEGESAMRLDVCDKCHAYLKTYNEEGEEEIYLRDWATIHLDFLGEEKSLQKKGSVMLANA
ncbi:MAG: formate dehydrogenase accessory protein FdhE [Selenomonas sp.]|uniref:formate dehydrogenase accessory protein FdhE n=1 Tax=Selenomonas sp. TaxID=2053611 RepID=UPI0025EF3D82|nr:formate dehydrogenase accessory protein FdhE [Selenomonas sp.]MCR5439769.1 formate dehydrogenase accessory protein FdhE [Selenomonas sp.]